MAPQRQLARRDSCRDAEKYTWLAPDEPLIWSRRMLVVAVLWLALALGYIAAIAWLVRG